MTTMLHKNVTQNNKQVQKKKTGGTEVHKQGLLPQQLLFHLNFYSALSSLLPPLQSTQPPIQSRPHRGNSRQDIYAHAAGSDLCLCSDESLPVSNHLNEKLQCTLQYQRAVVGNIPKDEQGVDTRDIVSPARKVSDDGLK